MTGYSVIQQAWARMPGTLRPIMRRMSGRIVRAVTRPVVNRWPPYSHLFLVSDSSFWVIFWEMRELAAVARRIGVQVAHTRWLSSAQNQAVFYGSHFFLADDAWVNSSHRVGTAYFHGRPGTGLPEFDRAYNSLRQYRERIHRIQVSHTEVRDLVLSSGIAPQKVFLIPIGINLSYFSLQTAESRCRARMQLGIPESAVVVGSFQKDGVGWGEGLEPKLIKGPDVFLRVIGLLKSRVPELFVLLSGPARGFVKAGLEQLGVPYCHRFLKQYPQVGQLFQALDVYIVASRQEGGPKAVLESMASGIPLVTTRVGQAMDLVQHGENGWMVEVEDAEGLAYWAEYVVDHIDSLGDVIRRARQSAEENSYEAQIPLWRSFMRGFVEWER